MNCTYRSVKVGIMIETGELYISVKVGIMIETGELYILIPVWLTLTFIHGHSFMRNVKLGY